MIKGKCSIRMRHAIVRVNRQTVGIMATKSWLCEDLYIPGLLYWIRVKHTLQLNPDVLSLANNIQQ